MEFSLLMSCRVIVEKREMYRTVFECLLGQFYLVLSTELYLSACEGRFVFGFVLSTELYLSAC